MDNLKIESVNINDIKPYKNNAKEYKKKYYQEHKDEISRKSKEYRLKNKEKIKQRQHEWYMRNKEQVIERVTEYNKNNNDKRKQWTKNYKIKNIDKINQYKNNNKENLKNYHNKYMKDKMQNDSVFKLKALLRSNIYNAFKRKNMIKDEKAEQILGCNIDEFVQYLLQTFKDNYGYEYNGTEEVHIDHIVPLATAKTKQDIKKLCNYKNLQLLKAHDNLIKWACN